MRKGRLKSLLDAAKDEGWSDWIRSEADKRAVLGGCWFDLEAASRVVTFFERFLKLSKGQWAGKPFILQDWQKQNLLMPLFGWKKRNGFRRFRNAYIEIPKKNGKSALCSGIALYLLVADGEPGAEVYVAAADKKQAGIVYGEAERMVRASPSLSKRLAVVPSQKTIAYPKQNGTLQALSADVATKEGYNIHGLIFDELHAQPNRKLFDTLRYGGASRRQPLFASITTAGFDRNSICWEQREYARKILKGLVDDESFFALIYAANEDANEGPVDDWTQEATWYKANPSLGVTIDLESFAAECRKAQETPTLQNTFKRYRLNIWTSSDVRWMPMDKWDASAGEVDPEALLGRECYGGLDLASTIDVAACPFLFPDGDAYKVMPLFWIPQENMEERVRRDRVPYDVWVRQGLVKATPGNAIDYAFIEADILAFAAAHSVREIAYDPWNSSEIIQRLSDAGLTMVPIRQGYASMSGPMKQMEALVYSGKLHHGGHPVLRWMADNVQASIDPAGNLKPDKGKSREKIDGIVGCIMALGRAGMRGNQKSVYEERGIVTL